MLSTGLSVVYIVKRLLARRKYGFVAIFKRAKPVFREGAVQMKLSLAVPTPLEYFVSLVQSDADFPLLEAAASLAQDEYPDLDVQQVLDEVDQLLVRLKRQLPADAEPLQKLRAINQFFFRDLGFALKMYL